MPHEGHSEILVTGSIPVLHGPVTIGYRDSNMKECYTPFRPKFQVKPEGIPAHIPFTGSISGYCRWDPKCKRLKEKFPLEVQTTNQHKGSRSEATLCRSSLRAPIHSPDVAAFSDGLGRGIRRKVASRGHDVSEH